MSGPADIGRTAQMPRRLRARKLLAAAVALAVAAATVVSLPLAQPAEAQSTTVTLISNEGQEAVGLNSLGSSEAKNLNAQPFTTGTNATGYTLKSIDIKFWEGLDSSDVANLDVQLWSDSSGVPGSKLADLTVPSSVPAAWVAFTAPDNTNLAASTTYHVVVDADDVSDSSFSIHLTGTAEDSGGAAGWSIGNALLDKESGFSWAVDSANEVGYIRVKGYANPAASTLVSNTGQTTNGQARLTNGFRRAMAFTTGSSQGGYTLTSVDVLLDRAGTSLTAQLWSATSQGAPNSKLEDLTVPSSLSTGTVSLAAPLITLDASTTYFVVLTGTSSARSDLNLTNSNAEDSGGAAGWTLGNNQYVFSGGNWVSSGGPLKIQVKGYANQQSGGQTQSSVATLSSLSGTPCTDASTCSGSLSLSPAFDADTTSYTASVANSVTHLKVTPTVTESNATVKAGLGSSLTAVTSGSASSSIALSVGSNTVNVEVTAQDGTTTKTYAITVTRRSAVAANSIQIWSVVPKDKAFTVSWDFASGVCYGNVRWRVKDIDLAMSGLQPGEWELRGAPRFADGACDTTTSLQVPFTANLVNGQVYEIQALGVIDASDTYTSWSASVEGTPAGSVADAVSLSALTGTTSTDGTNFTAGALTLNPAFGEDSEFYSVSVPAAVTHMKLTPTVKTTGATVTVGRKGATPASVTSGMASAALALRPGYDDYEVKVTHSGTTQTYTLRVVRQAVPTITAAPAALNGKPAISYTQSSLGRSGYTVALQVKLADESWPARDTGAVVTPGGLEGGGTNFDSGASPLRIGSLKKNTAYHVRAHYVDGSGLVDPNRGLPVEASSSQIAVTTWDVPGTPTSVTASAASATSLTVGWTAPTDTGGTGASITGYRVRWRIKDTDAVMAGNQPGSWNNDDGVAATGTSYTATGLTAATTYEVQVRALNGIDPGSSWSTTAEATTSAATQSSVATLQSLTGTPCTDATTCSGSLTLDPVFDSGTTAYTASVANSVTHLKVTPTVTQADATVQAGKGSSLSAVTSGSASGAIALSVGSNTINVKVTAQDGTTTETYAITVTRGSASGSAGVTVSSSAFSLRTGSTAAYTVVLDTQPSAAVTVTPTSATTTAATVSPASLTFTTTNWNEPQAVTVTAVASGSSVISHAATSADSTYDGISVGSVTATVGAGPAAPTMFIANGGDAVLALGWTAPAGTLTGYDLHVTSAPTSGTGAVANNAVESGSDRSKAWVPVTSPPGATSLFESVLSLDNGTTYRVRLRAKTSAGVGAWAYVSGTPNISLRWGVSTATVTEGETASFPTLTASPVSEAVSGTLTYAAGDTDPASLSADLTTGYATTFSATADQYVSTTPPSTVDDSVNEEDETFKVTIDAGSGYVVGTPATIVVTITDNDAPAAPSGLSLTAGAQKLAVSWTKPAGPVAGYQLRYKTSTAMDRTATTAGDPSTGWVTTTQFNAVSTQITSLTNGTAYNVQVRATDGQTFSGNGYGDWSASQTGTPTATPTAGVTVSTTSVSVVAGSTTTYTIKLNKAPTADVTVTPTSGDTDKATVTNQAKTFTTTNWSQAQTVTVTGVAAGSSTITHAATSTDTAYQGISVASVAATVTAATQTAPTTLTLTTDAASNTVAEDGGNVTVTATLNRAATTAVSVTLSATGTATVTDDYSLPAAFTIPVGSTSATGTVSIVDDDLDEDNETVILSTTVSGLTVTGVTLTITDDDTAGVSVSQTSRSVQAASTTSYTVVLDSKPTANVTVTPTSGTPANATVSPASRTFTPQNWNTAQSFTITGVQAGSSTITHAATSTDAKYPSSLSIGSVAVTVTPQPPTTLELTTSAAANTVAENGGSVTVTATLNRPATTAVSVTLTATGTATATADYSLPAAFTIAVGQSSATGTLTVVNDAVDEDNETVILSTTVSGLTVTGVTLTIADDDTAGVTVSHTALDVQDGATATYTVVLDSKPTANVVVGATSGTPAHATVAPASRTFTPANWDTPQTFTVTGVASGSSTITHAVISSADAKYPSSLSVGSVAVRVNPDDSTLSALSFSFSADGGATFSGSGKLTPEFDPATRSYTIELSPSATHVRFTPTANHPGATIRVNSVATASGSASAAIAVGEGRVTVSIRPPSGAVGSYVFVLTSGGGAAAGQLGNTVWTSVLVMRDLQDNGEFLGCDNATRFAAGDRCNNVATLSQDTYYFAGAPGWSAADPESRGDNDWRVSRKFGGIRIRGLFTENQGANVPRQLVLNFTQNVPESLRQSLTLVFDGRSFPLRDGVIRLNAPTAITWSDTGIAPNEHVDDQVVGVGLYLNPVGPSVTEWQPTMRARSLSGAKAGCDGGCGDPVVFGGNRFSVDAPKFGGLRSYRVTELTSEVVARYGHGVVYRRVTLSVEEDGGTVSLNGMTLELTANGQTVRLPIRRQNRVANTNTWVWGFESSDALSWGPYSTVGVRIIAVTTGLQTVRVYYDEMRNGQPVDGFVRWDIARAKPHATLDRALIAVIPGEFTSINTRKKLITTHARLLLRGDWPASTITYGKGTWDAPPASFTAVGADGLTAPIALNAAKSNTYVWVRVTNGDQAHTHLVIIDPPPRTYKVNPQLAVTEGEDATVTVSLGRPATRGGVTFEVSAAYGDGGATADDVGEIVSTVTVPEGERSAQIAVPTVDDEAVEDDESFTVTLTHVGEPTWAVEPDKTATATITIADDDQPPPGPEPWNIVVTPGDGTLTVTWNVSSRDGYDDSEIWHALRWFQPYGGPHRWDNPRDRRAVGRNDGLSMDPGVTSYTITGLTNGVATDVFVRSMVGHRNNMSERLADSSKWVKVTGDTAPVAPPNEAPTVAYGIADVSIASESGTGEVSLWGVFADADGDDLAVAAVSSDENVAAVSVSADFATLSVNANARGTATVTVTADDGSGGSVQDSFTVTVKAAPAVESAIADVDELVIDATHEVPLSGVFSDPDGDPLTITAASSDSAVATVSATIDPATGSATALTVTATGEGTATVTVIARDSDGNSVSDDFDVTVPAPEVQPLQAAQEPEAQQEPAVTLPGAVTDLTLTVNGNTVTVSWTAPTDGDAPARYIVHLRPEDGKAGSGKTKRPKAPKTQVKYNNLEPGTTYQVWVRARNDAGKGERTHATITLPE